MADNPKSNDWMPPLKPTSFTVSYTFDTHRFGVRHNHFATMAFEVPSGTLVDMVVAMSIKGSAYVTKAAILHALARGQITKDEAKEHLTNMGQNHENLLESARKSLDEPKE